MEFIKVDCFLLLCVMMSRIFDFSTFLCILKCLLQAKSTRKYICYVSLLQFLVLFFNFEPFTDLSAQPFIWFLWFWMNWFVGLQNFDGVVSSPFLLLKFILQSSYLLIFFFQEAYFLLIFLAPSTTFLR